MQTRRTIVALALLGLVAIGGCVTPNDAAPVAQQQVGSIDRIASAYADDLIVQRALFSAVLDAQRVQLVGDLHRELLLAGYVKADGSADLAAFRRDVADARSQAAIVREVRLGRMSQDQADRFLLDYAALIPVPSAAELRREMLSRLFPVVAFDANRDALLAAQAGRAETVGAMLADARANAESLRAFAEAKYLLQDSLQSLAAGSWSRVVAGVKDPGKRAALEAAGSQIIGGRTPGKAN